MAKGSVLLIEDEDNIASLVQLYLTNEGFKVTRIADGAEAVTGVRRHRPNLVLLDLSLPGMDGIEICKEIRKLSQVPIIMLTARDGEIDRVLGLEIGADDYVTKPFSPRELVARVKAVLRRGATSELPHRMTLGEIEVDMGRREVVAKGVQVTLTAKEFDLLAYLIENRGIVLSRDQLMENVWGYERPVDSRTVDSHIKSTRRKLGEAGSHIQTLRGVGYRIDVPR